MPDLTNVEIRRKYTFPGYFEPDYLIWGKVAKQFTETLDFDGNRALNPFEFLTNCPYNWLDNFNPNECNISIKVDEQLIEHKIVRPPEDQQDVIIDGKINVFDINPNQFDDIYLMLRDNATGVSIQGINFSHNLNMTLPRLDLDFADQPKLSHQDIAISVLEYGGRFIGAPELILV